MTNVKLVVSPICWNKWPSSLDYFI